MSEQYNIKQYIIRLKAVILEKKEQPIVCNKVTLDWKSAQLTLCEQFSNPQLIDKLIDLQRECVNNKISCFYSFFIMQKCLKNSNLQAILEKQRIDIQREQSKYHSIKSYIKMREHLLSKINKFTGNYIKSLFEDIDDIRFLNFEIITLIKQWKEQWRTQDEIQPVYYDGNMNYLLKINNDNADMINLANFKKTKFISPPNPFFLSEDGNLQGMGLKQRQDINDCMQLINKERGIDLRMSVQGGIFVVKNQKSTKNQKSKSISNVRKDIIENSFVKDAKNDILSVKQEEIRKIYKINKSLQKTKTKANLEKMTNIQIRKISNDQKETQKLKMYTSQKSKQKIQSKAIKQPKAKQAKIIEAKLSINKVAFPINSSNPSQASKVGNSSLRSEINRVVKELTQTQSPIKKKEVRQMKPKIKLIEEKSSTVIEESSKSIGNNASSIFSATTRSLSRKNSTFYKKIIPIAEETQQHHNSKPTTQNLRKRPLSQSHFYSIKEKKQQSEKQPKNNEKNIESSIVSKKQPAQSQIRTLNSQIKNLTIINIYKGKRQLKKQRNKSLQSFKAEEESIINLPKHNATSFLTEIDQQPESKIDASKFSLTYEKMKNQNEIEISKLSQELEKKAIKKQKNQQVLQQKQRKRLEAQKELELKSLVISELEEKLKHFESQKTGTRRKEESLKHHTKQYQRTKKMREIQSKILKDKIKSQQQKFIQNRQLQLKIKQEQMKKQFKKNIKSLELQTLKKRKTFEKQLIQQEKRMKQTEKMIIKEKNKFKEIQNELEQKKLKEKLLRKIMEEKEEAITKQGQSQKQLQKILQNQMKLREKMEIESLQLLEKEKKKMEVVYQEMIEKNKLIQEENKLKLKELNDIDLQRNRELEKMKQLEVDFQRILKNEQQQKMQQQSKQEVNQSPQDMETLRVRLRQELLQQIKKKKEKEQLEQREDEERRKKRLKRIEEEVALTLKAEQDSLQRQNLQFLKKLQHMKELSMIPSTHQQERDIWEPQLHEKLEKISDIEVVNNENHSVVEGSQENEPVTFQLKAKESKIEDNEVEKEIKEIEEMKVKKQQKQVKLEGSTKKDSQIQIKNSSVVDSPKKEVSPAKLSAKIVQNQEENLQFPQNQSQKPKEAKSEPEDLLQKYKNLGQYIKKTKQIVIQDKNISSFLDTFIHQLEKPMREMLFWSKFDLERILNTKRVDIYDYNTIGWLDEKDKYSLIGGIQCIENITKKYGAVQIHQVFLFDKSNPYQKQLLTKKMKLFESIGFVYQKKLPQSNKYSIRFVIKLPKEVAGQLKSVKQKITSKISLQNYHQTSLESEKYQCQCSFSYLASRLFKNNLEKPALEATASQQDSLHQSIQKHLSLGRPISTFKHLSIEEINDNIIAMEMPLPFKYYRAHERAFYLVKCSQYQYQNNHFYVSYLEEGLAIVLQQTKATNIPLDSVLFNTIQSINLASKVGEVDVCLPIWQYNSTAQLQDSSISYVHRQKLEIELFLGSIASTFLLKHHYVEFRAPFIMSYCELSKQKQLIRPLSGHLITHKDIILQNLK